MLVVLDVRRFHNAVVLFLKPFKCLQCSCECRVALRFAWCEVHEFTLMSVEILLCCYPKIYFFIDRKFTFLSFRESLCYRVRHPSELAEPLRRPAGGARPAQIEWQVAEGIWLSHQRNPNATSEGHIGSTVRVARTIQRQHPDHQALD